MFSKDLIIRQVCENFFAGGAPPDSSTAVNTLLEEINKKLESASQRINEFKEETVYPRTRDLRRLIMKEDNKNTINENNKGGVEK